MADIFNKDGTQADGEQRRCSKCGKILASDELFCESCGAKAPEPKSSQSDSYRSESPQQNLERKPLRYLVIGCGVVLVVSYLLIFFFGGKFSEKDFVQREPVAASDVDGDYLQGMEEDADLIETEETESETEPETDVEADIDAVHNRICKVSGLFFYTDNMEAPVLILDSPASVYVNSTSGEPVHYASVSQISFGTCSIGKKKLKKYNNIEVDVTGSLWAEDDFLYIDVQELSGELPETEPETKKETEPEVDMDADYILPESNSKLLTDADVAGLSLQEINYAKNEIYARHGRKFDSPELQRYFKSKTWYKDDIAPDKFSTDVFNRYERKNVQFLAQKEESMQKGGYKLDQ